MEKRQVPVGSGPSVPMYTSQGKIHAVALTPFLNAHFSSQLPSTVFEQSQFQLI